MKNIKMKTWSLIFSIVTAGILILSGTYALFKWTSSGTNVAIDAHLGVVYEREHETLTGTLNPTNSKEGGLSTNITLWTTTKKTKVYGTLFFSVKSIPSPLNTNSMLKWELWNDNTKISSGDFNGYGEGDIVELFKDIELSNEEDIFTLYVWLDDDCITTTDIKGTSIEIDVGASAAQIPTSESSITVVNNSPSQTNWVKNYTLLLTATSTEYNITGYAVTTSSDTPSAYTQISNAGLTYNLSHTVDANGNYFVWFRNQNNKIAYEVVEVNKVDNIKPVLNRNGDSSVDIANSNATIVIPLKIVDTQSGINIDTFTDDDLIFKVGTTTISPTKSITYQSVSDGEYSYLLTLSNVTGNGKLNIEAPSGVISDTVGNTNILTTIDPFIDIDNTPPVVSSIEASQYSSTISIKATATDSYGVVDTYWYSIDGENYYSSNNSNYTFNNVSNGSYTAYVYVKDKAGNTSNIKEQSVVFDNVPPTLTSLKVTTSSGTYAYGSVINISAIYSENVFASDGKAINASTAPTLSLKFGNGTSKNATFVSVSDNTINYKVVVDIIDLGALTLSSYQGIVYDQALNSLNVTATELGGNAVSASTKAKIGTNYYTTLASAIAVSSTTKSITMVNDTTECVTIPSTNNITLDLYGKVITCDTSNTSAITNNGILKVVSSQTNGEINSTYYAINNLGSLILTSGKIQSTNNVAVYNNSTKTQANGVSLYVDGATVISTSNSGINNVTTGIVTVASGTVKGALGGIYNTTTGTINIGLSTDTLSTTNPAVYNTTTSSYGVYMNSSGTLNLYNGAIYTANTSVGTAYFKNTSTVTARSGYHITTATDTLGGVTYKKSYLVSGTTQIQYRKGTRYCESYTCSGTKQSSETSSCVYSSPGSGWTKQSGSCASKTVISGTCQCAGGSVAKTDCEKAGFKSDTDCFIWCTGEMGGSTGEGCTSTKSYAYYYTKTITESYENTGQSSCNSSETATCESYDVDYGSWGTTDYSSYTYCQKRTCNLSSEGVVTTCGSAGSC